ncbi:hypothetical protein HNQ44_001309 [Planomicrobium koreense]|uniref:Uncharacterized protein n=1 Tax=Planococcus koreensis TaxID=112331 RepID=A0A7W8CTU9_9BACL|nr:hypothetical protein [Planococcus koreensis]MBB5179885.1 hypothetical protein [Planococcus koreensis]
MSDDISLLVGQAEERGLEYVVMMYKQFTNSYHFHAGVKSED